MHKIIEIKNLTLKTKDKTLLYDISFDVDENETLIILGHNGAGKSLLIDCIIGNLKYQGKIIKRICDKNKIGILYDQFSSLPLLKVREILQLLEAIYRSPRDENLINALSIYPLMGRYFKLLSKGERKKIGLYASLFMKPTLLVLDEPSDGLDPEFRNYFWEMMRKFEGTLILTTHLWEEAKYISDKVVFLENGSILGKPINYKDKIVELKIKGKIIVDDSDYGLDTNNFRTIVLDNKKIIYFRNEKERDKIIEQVKHNANVGFSVLPIDLQDVYYNMKHEKYV